MLQIAFLNFSCEKQSDIEIISETGTINYGVSKETLLNSKSFNRVLSKLRTVKTVNKKNGDIKDLTAQQMIERLNFENTYFFLKTV